MKLWQRRWFRILAIALAVLVPCAAFAGIRGARYIRTDPQFCMSCHLMDGPAEKWRHSSHREVSCQTCHRVDIFEEAHLGYAAVIQRKTEIGPHAKVPPAICMECHVSQDPRWKQIAGTPGHGTHVARRGFACLDCHATRLHEFKADTAACLRCHGQGKLKLEKMETLHCLGCHDFLGKQGASMIPTASNCRQCHAAERDDTAAVATLFSLAGKPASLVGKPAPVWKGHEDCLGCHRPHGKPLADPIDCLACHRKLLEADNKHYKDERLSTACRECHEPHAAKAK